MRFSLLAALTALASFAVADVEFTVPAAGASVVGGSAFTVTFKDTGDAPKLAALSSYELFLCAGGNTAATYTQLLNLVTGGTFTTLTKSVTVPVGIGGTGTNAYFLMMISTATAGGTITNFSDRFTLTGMTGVFSAVVQAGVATVSGTAGPDTIDNVVDTAATTAAAAVPAGTEMYTVPYYLQTGLTKYAPMQPVPGTKITAKSATPLFPTSSYDIATTYLPIASIVITMTLSQTVSVSSAENTIAAAQTRTRDDMGNWLKRWAD